MASVNIAQPEIESVTLTLDRRVLQIGSAAQEVIIRNADEYRAAGEISTAIANLRKEVESAFNPIIQKAYEAHKIAIEQKKKYLSPLEANQRIVDQKMLAWDQEQERIRREEEEKLRAIAQKDAEDQALREAEELARQGENHLADIVLETAASAPKPVISLPRTTPVIQGFGKRVNYKWRIKKSPKCVDKSPSHDTMRCKACIAQVGMQFLVLDTTAINGVVRSLKMSTQISGVEVYDEFSATHRS